MFKFPSLKLYRKFLILAVMITSLFILSSTRRVAADSCCDDCIAALPICHVNCLELPEAVQRIQCVHGCISEFYACSDLCGVPSGCPIT